MGANAAPLSLAGTKSACREWLAWKRKRKGRLDSGQSGADPAQALPVPGADRRALAGTGQDAGEGVMAACRRLPASGKSLTIASLHLMA